MSLAVSDRPIGQLELMDPQCEAQRVRLTVVLDGLLNSRVGEELDVHLHVANRSVEPELTPGPAEQDGDCLRALGRFVRRVAVALLRTLTRLFLFAM